MHLHDMSLELPPPDEVLAPLCAVPVPRKCPEEVVERWTRRGSDMEHAQRVPGWGQGRERSERATPGDVIDGHHVYGVVDVRDKTELDAALDEAPNEVVGVGH